MNRLRLRPTLRFSTFESLPLSQLNPASFSAAPSPTFQQTPNLSGVTRKFSELSLPSGSSPPSLPSESSAAPSPPPPSLPETVSSMESLSISQGTPSSPAVPPASRTRPNFFIGIRLTCPIFQQLVSQFQQKILTKSPHLKKCLTSVQKLHLTCFVFSLPSPDDILFAQNLFLSCKDKLSALLLRHSSPLSLTFDSLSQFGSNVLYIAPQENETLQLFREMNSVLAEEFHRVGIFTDPKEMARARQWNPHLTIAKTSAGGRGGGRGRGGGGVRIRKEDYENCTEMFENGGTVTVAVEQIDLLSMSAQSEDGYYKSYGTLQLSSLSIPSLSHK